jgi:hypothetical protein
MADIAKAREYVKAVDLAGTPRDIGALDIAAETGEAFDQTKKQAQVVGSGLFSFAEGVGADVREAISDSALLAQLVANKRVTFEQDPITWFRTYAEVLENVGWTLQEGGWSDYTSRGTSGEVHEKIVDVLTIALGPAPAALAIVVAAVGALKAMKPDSSWIKIFSRESQKAKLARFQIGLVEKEDAGQVFVSLLACLIEAKTTITQVLFFKFKDAQAAFKANGSKVSINRASLAELGPTIRKKIKAYQADYLSSIVDI